MSLHTFTKIWLHLIWSTHNKERILLKDTIEKVSSFLYKYAKDKKIYMRINHVNAEHVHVLLNLPVDLPVKECLKLLKGSSSHFINQERLTPTKFSWGRGYGAFSVSESGVNKVTEYIRNQDEHHRAKSFSEEYELFIKKYGLNINRHT